MAPPPLGPMRESVGIRQIFANGVLQAAAVAMDLVGINVTTEKGTNGVLRYKVDIPGSSFSTALEARVAALEATVTGITPYAVAGGKWNMVGPITTDTPLSIGDFARVDMSGKVGPDFVVLTLPLSDSDPETGNVGRAISFGTINLGGAANGSYVRIATQGGQLVTTFNQPILDLTGETRGTLVSNGNGWDLQYAM